MKRWAAVFVMATAPYLLASEPSAVTNARGEGRSLFLACEYKHAARAFQKALALEPENAALHYWLGKSYARLAETAGPLSAPKIARKARRNLERAVGLDPHNEDYLLELFDFYLDSPEWFHGGLERAAALLERINADDGARLRIERLSDSRKDHSGPGWWMQRVVLGTSGAFGYAIP